MKRSKHSRSIIWALTLVIFLMLCILLGIVLLLIQNKTVNITDALPLGQSSYDRPEGEVAYSTTITTDPTGEYDQYGQPILRAERSGKYHVFAVSSKTNNRTASLPLDTRIFVQRPDNSSTSHSIWIHPKRPVLGAPKGIFHLPLQTMNLYQVIGEGTVTITVVRDE